MAKRGFCNFWEVYTPANKNSGIDGVPQVTEVIRDIPQYDLETNEHIFNIRVFKTNQQNVRAYRATKLNGTEIGTKYFLDDRKICEVKAAFLKDCRQKGISLGLFAKVA